jgi:predicted amino acid-binding ACT domain protein
MLVARNTTGNAIPLTTIERGLRAVDRKYGLKTSCFIPPTTGEHDDEPNVDIVISAANEVGLLSRIVGKLAARGIDMMDIDIALDVEETRCTLFLSCNVPIEEESFFETLQAIRGDLDSLGLTDFVVHSPEALDSVTYIDYERPL